jgi:serine/threonine protein kinase
VSDEPKGPAEADLAEDVRLDDLTEGLVLPARSPMPAAAEPDEPPTARAGEVLAQRYVIKHLIARGGMGRVYLATQVPLGRDVAVKCLIPRTNDREFRQRFFLEASTCARLTHRHIVTVYDYGETESGELYMAMEYLRGEPLSLVLAKAGRLGPTRAAHVALQIARALRAAHRRGVVHRDLKPGNVMLVEDDDQLTRDFVKVLDFGLVKVFEAEQAGADTSDLTRAGMWLGSPRYMAPEQIRCADVDPRTDLYALGAITFHMLAGRPPFTGNSSAEIFGQHLRDPVPSIRALAGVDVPPELERIVRRCLEKAPDQRYPSLDELITELHATLSALVGSGASRAATDLTASSGSGSGLAAYPGLESMLDEGSGVVMPYAPRPSSLAPHTPSLTPSAPGLHAPSLTPSAPGVHAPSLTPSAPGLHASSLTPHAPSQAPRATLSMPHAPADAAPHAAPLTPAAFHPHSLAPAPYAAPARAPSLAGASAPPEAATPATGLQPWSAEPARMLAPPLSTSAPSVPAGVSSAEVTGLNTLSAQQTATPRGLYVLLALTLALVAIMGFLLLTRAPADELPASATTTSTPSAPAAPPLTDLEEKLDAVLAKRGMVQSDLLLLPEARPKYEAWQAQRAAGEAARAPLVALLDVAATAPFNEQILTKYLDRLDSAVAAQADKLPPPKFEALKLEYLDLYRQVQLATTPPEREVMVQAIQRFERKMVAPR